MGCLPMAPSSSLASSPCLRTFGFSRSQLSFGQFAADHHAILLSQMRRELLSVSNVRSKQIQLVGPTYSRNQGYHASESKHADEPSIDTGMRRLRHTVNQMKFDPKSDYRQSMMVALQILQKHADNEKNRKNMRDLLHELSNDMAPLSSDLHRDDHGAWSGLAVELLQLMWLLVDDPSRTASEMKLQMANQEQIKKNINRIIKSDKCDEHLRMLAKEILAHVEKNH